MYSYNLLTREQLTRVIETCTRNNWDYSGLSDAGTEVSRPTKFHFKEQGRSGMSKLTFVYTQGPIDFTGVKHLFGIPPVDGPMVETHFWDYLHSEYQAQRLPSDSSLMIEDYLNSLCMDRDTQYTNKTRELRIIAEHFWFYMLKPVKLARPKELSIDEELQLLTVSNNVVSLPSVELKHYKKIKSLMINAGGKYSLGSFVFEVGAEEKLAQIKSGKKINLKQDYQYFPTPTELAKTAIAKSGLTPGMRWLEPSAGCGRIARLMREISDNGVVVELMPENINKLLEQGFEPINENFLELSPLSLGLFDVIVANPPFKNNQDISHFEHMISFLKPQGTIVCFTSKHYDVANTKRHQEFKCFLQASNSEVIDIPAGAFNESGTNVGTNMIVFRKQIDDFRRQTIAFDMFELIA